MLLNDYYLKNLAFGLVISLFSLNVISQEKSPKFNNTPGHALYKRSKLYDSKSGVTSNKRQIIGDKAADRIAYEFELLKNPNTGKIPKKDDLLQFTYVQKNLRTNKTIVYSNSIIEEFFKIALAMDSLCFCPPDNRTPRSPTRVSYFSGKPSTKSAALAFFAAT